MYYYDPNDRSSRRWGAVAAACYLLLLVAAFCCVRFDFGTETLRPGEGILIDFGSSSEGSGERDLQATDTEAPPQSAAPAAAETGAEYSVTEESDVEIRETRPTPAAQRETAAATARQPAETAPAEQPRTVNTRALFPGRTTGSPAESQGETGTTGNAGDPSGAPQGDPAGTAQGEEGVAYDLSGRSVVGSLPVPAYTADAAGKVIIDVTVDASGRVTNAAYHPQGSTTNNAELVAAARKAAMQARFSESESFVQGGTITYIFRMK